MTSPASRLQGPSLSGSPAAPVPPAAPAAAAPARMAPPPSKARRCNRPFPATGTRFPDGSRLSVMTCPPVRIDVIARKFPSVSLRQQGLARANAAERSCSSHFVARLVLQFQKRRAGQGYSALQGLGSGFSALAAALPLISMIYERW